MPVTDKQIELKKTKYSKKIPKIKRFIQKNTYIYKSNRFLKNLK